MVYRSVFRSVTLADGLFYASHLAAVGYVGVTRRFIHRSPIHRFSIDPSKQPYSMDHAFEEPTFRFICEGTDIDYKQEVRAAFLELMPASPSNFTLRTEETLKHESLSFRTVQLLRGLAKKQLLSFAQIKSTPQLFFAFFETLASCYAPLALLASEHFTFAAMIALHGTDEAQSAVLDGVDSCRIIGTIAHRELTAEGVPFNTEARYDKHEDCFFLRGTGKFGVVAATCADWAIVTATVTLNKKDNQGAHLFLVRLREGGALQKGISASPIGGEHSGMSGCGFGVLHFDEVRLPVSALLLPSKMVDGELKSEGDSNTPTALQALTLQMRLATAALYAGTAKKFLTDIVHYVSKKYIVGPDGYRNYPFFGVQHIQTDLVSLVAKSYVYLAVWRRVLPAFTQPTAKRQSTYEDAMRLAGTVHFLQETILELCRFSDDCVGVHASMQSTGRDAAALVVHLRQEGLDRSALIRDVAFRSVSRNIGTSHWGWWLSSLLEPFAALDRFVRNPFYSPRIADLGRHLMFFSHKHYRAKKRLRQSREIERRRGGAEHQWYDWVMFRHHQVLHCGEAYMEMQCMEVMMDETQTCTDPRGRKLLRDIGWIFAIARQRERLYYILQQQMMSPSKSIVLESHLDNLVTVLAPQCVNLVEAFQVPLAVRAPCAAADMEPYWTIPGTNTGIQRGDKVVSFRPESTENTKKTQESMQESDEDEDFFHGLADKPSYAYKRAHKRLSLMDLLHESHLERILENRRRRGVLGSVAPHQGPLPIKKPSHDAPLMVDSYTSPMEVENATNEDYRAADQKPPAGRPQNQTAAVPDGSFQSSLDSRMRSSNNDNGINNGDSNGFIGSRKANGEHGLRWSNSVNRQRGRSPPAAIYRGQMARDRSAPRRSPQRTVPLLTYNSLEASLHSPSCLRRESYTSPNRSVHYDNSSAWLPNPSRSHDPSRIRNSSWGRNPSRVRDSSWGRNPSRIRDSSWGHNPSRVRDSSWGHNPSRVRDSSWGRHPSRGRDDREEENGGPASQRAWRGRANGGFHGFPDESRNLPAGSVIYEGEEQRPSEWSPHRQAPLPFPQLPHPLRQQGQREPQRQLRNDSFGLTNAHTTMNIRTSVSILAGGDWFYKWNVRGTAVSPRWVWIDTRSYLLLWSHKEAQESVFSGTIKLEKILQVSAREINQTNEKGVPQTYYVLLLETAKRVLQIGTERRSKADAWYEALNNVLLYIRNQNFKVPA